MLLSTVGLTLFTLSTRNYLSKSSFFFLSFHFLKKVNKSKMYVKGAECFDTVALSNIGFTK